MALIPFVQGLGQLLLGQTLGLDLSLQPIDLVLEGIEVLPGVPGAGVQIQDGKLDVLEMQVEQFLQLFYQPIIVFSLDQ